MQAGAIVGSDAAQQSVESHLVLVGVPVPGFNAPRSPRPGEISSWSCLHDVDSIGQSSSGMSNGMRRLRADVPCLRSWRIGGAARRTVSNLHVCMSACPMQPSTCPLSIHIFAAFPRSA